MSRVHLVLLWHMHQPQYRDPATKRYILPWTRLHALKDYWGMVRVLEEFPGVHATFNVVPSMAEQIEDYARGTAQDPWLEIAFKAATELTENDKQAILGRAFQINRERLMSRWPRFIELFAWAEKAGMEHAAGQFSLRDWRDLQLLSQLAWMDEEYLATDPVVNALSAQGANYSEEDKAKLHAKQLELLQKVLPEYRAAAERGQIEISTTPFYHPILPLLCDSQIARVANPHTPPLNPPYRCPEDAREQLIRARNYHARLFGREADGLWPSEGSVSDEALTIAAQLGFRWFATDEGVLGRTRNIGFWRDAAGVPDNAHELYAPWRFRFGGREIYGFFRDHYLSDLIGFVYSQMDAHAAAEDFHRRLRQIAERFTPERPATVSVILDGENAWEYYPGNGREFLRQLYCRIQGDSDIQALTVSEAIAAAGETGALEGIFPASWINANFDIWIGHSEDIRAWELLRQARETYGRAHAEATAKGDIEAEPRLLAAYEALLPAEGSDWCWWYGPEHSSANDREFDELYRKHLSDVYAALGLPVPDELTQPIKTFAAWAQVVPPSDWLNVQIDGRVTSYFEWLGAGYYSSGRRGGAMHGQTFYLGELFYGFSAENFFLRIDPLRETFEMLRDCELRLTLKAANELKIALRIQEGKLSSLSVQENGNSPANARISAGIGKVIELAIARGRVALAGQKKLRISASLWRDGLPVDLLPHEGAVEIPLGEENWAWPGEA